jgi:O-acetyl-ADP-ribose deacetylase (regulator of RNase III)
LCRQGQLEVGQLHVYQASDKIIVNFPTKQHWRQPSRIEYIEAGLKAFVAGYEAYGITAVSFPQLGCGYGGLIWETQVKHVMEHYLSGLSIPVYIHLYTPNLDKPEPNRI